MKKLGIGFPVPEDFFHFKISSVLNIKKKLIFFVKIDRGYHALSFETSFVKIKHICTLVENTFFQKK